MARLKSCPFKAGPARRAAGFKAFLHATLEPDVLTAVRGGGWRMAYFERIRDTVTGPVLDAVVRQRTAAGWQPVSIEWRRELPDSERPTEGAFAEEIPYGLRISDDCKRLELDPRENQALLQMMEALVQDFSFSSIASDLNEKGFRTRDGKRWNPVAIFNMIPRLIEVGPRLFSTEEWERRREKFARMV